MVGNACKMGAAFLFLAATILCKGSLSILHALRRALAVSAGLMLWVWSTRRFAGRLHGR